MPHETKLTNTTFQEFVRTHKIAVVHFWARWNAYDSQMRTLLTSQVPADLRAHIAFAEFDVDSIGHKEICDPHRVLNVPFLAFYRDGEFVDSMTGMHASAAIVQRMTALIA